MKNLFGFWFPPRMRHCANYSSSPPPHCQPTGVWGEREEEIQISKNRVMSWVSGWSRSFAANLTKWFTVLMPQSFFSCAIGPEGELSLGKWSMFHTYLLLLAQKQEDNYKECLPFFGKLISCQLISCQL